MRYSSDENKTLNAVTLTAAYSGNTGSAIECRSVGSFTIIPQYTVHASGGAAAVAELQIEFSADGTNYSPSGTWADAGAGEQTYTADTYNVDQTNPRPQINISALGRYMRIKARESGQVASNFGTLTVYVYSNSI